MPTATVFGDAAVTQNACTQPAGFVSDSTDCDDDPLACGNGCFPGNAAADVCDGNDQDCDSLVDEDPESSDLVSRRLTADGFTATDPLADTPQQACRTTRTAYRTTEWVAVTATTDDLRRQHRLWLCGATAAFPGNAAARRL